MTKKFGSSLVTIHGSRFTAYEDTSRAAELKRREGRRRTRDASPPPSVSTSAALLRRGRADVNVDLRLLRPAAEHAAAPREEGGDDDDQKDHHDGDHAGVT